MRLDAASNLLAFKHSDNSWQGDQLRRCDLGVRHDAGYCKMGDAIDPPAVRLEKDWQAMPETLRSRGRSYSVTYRHCVAA